MDKLFIIKVGGNVIDEEQKLLLFLKDFTQIKARKILVHGGGKIATRIGEKLGIKANYVNGRRITDERTIDLVTMTYGGLINKKIVASLQGVGCNAIGLTGADGGLIPAVKRPVKEIDFGFVGDLETPPRLPVVTWCLFLENKLVPVVAPLTHDGHGQMLNTNADTIAANLAVALSVKYDVCLVFCFEKKGVLRDVRDDHSVIPLINKKIYRDLLAENAIAEGILPKLENAFDAIEHGVKKVIIGHADDLAGNTTGKPNGTLIK